MKYLSAFDVIAIHDDVIEPHQLQGCATDRSIESVIARIENRINYGLIGDIFELAACYAVYIAVGHAFNEANKRTAYEAMDICLTLNGIDLSYDAIEAGDKICEAARGVLDEFQLAAWLRQLYYKSR